MLYLGCQSCCLCNNHEKLCASLFKMDDRDTRRCWRSNYPVPSFEMFLMKHDSVHAAGLLECLGVYVSLRSFCSNLTSMPMLPCCPQGVLEKQKGSVQLEVQTRSCEYGRIFKYDAIRPQLLEHMPALDEATYSRNLGSALPTDTAAAAPQVGLLCMH